MKETMGANTALALVQRVADLVFCFLTVFNKSVTKM